MGHRIVVSNSWGFDLNLMPSSAVKLYINGQCVDTNTSLYLNKSQVALRGQIVANGQYHVVEVKAHSGMMKVKAKILVNGIKVGGDLKSG